MLSSHLSFVLELIWDVLDEDPCDLVPLQL